MSSTRSAVQQPSPPVLSFLPTNQSRSPPESRKRRAPQSCEPCRKRKVRCELPDGEHKCRRCLREHKLCEFGIDRRSKRSQPNVGASDEPTLAAEMLNSINSEGMRSESDHVISNGHPDREHQPTSRLEEEFSPGQSLFQPGERQKGPSASTESPVGVMSSPTDASAALDAKQRLISSKLYNTADALDLLTFAATGEQRLQNGSPADAQSAPRTAPPPQSNLPFDLGAEATHGSTEDDLAKWHRVRLIKRGILTREETIEYLNFFFEHLWPLKPLIPSFYSRPASYIILASEEPVLLTAIITLSSRYHHLGGGYGEIRSERIHWQAWRVLQRYLQSAVWGSRSTRTLGTISSMLLLIDWHVKAINNPSTFADPDADYEEDGFETTSYISEPPVDLTHLTSKQRHGMTGLLERLNIVSPAYRSNKMSWMLLSNAIALAQEGCCFEFEGPCSTINSPPSQEAQVKKEWNRIICVFIYLTDEHLALRLGLEPLLAGKSRKAVQKQFARVFANSLPDSHIWESYFELASELGKVRELLQRITHSDASSPPNHDLMHELQYIKRRFLRLQREHHAASDGRPCLLNTCLSIELSYAVLYSFSPITYLASIDNTSGTPRPSLAGQAPGTRETFAADAIQASRDLLSLVVDQPEFSRSLALLPVRCWLFITAAGLHLLKATVTDKSGTVNVDENIRLLHSMITTLKEASPDDMHMAGRYARFFEVLLNAALRPVMSGPGPTDVSSSEYPRNTENSDPAMADRPESLLYAPIFDIPGLALDAGPFHALSSATWWDSSLEIDHLALEYGRQSYMN